MKELERLLKLRKCKFELHYSSLMDFYMKLYLKGHNNDGRDLIIFEDQNEELEYLVNKCKAAYKDWLIENNNGY